MSTGKIITPNNNDAALEAIGALAQPVVLQFTHPNGNVETQVLGGLTKIETVAAQLLCGILSNPSGIPEDPVKTALTFAEVLLTKSKQINGRVPQVPETNQSEPSLGPR